MYTRAELDAFDDKEYRDAYVDSHVKSLIAHQVRCIRERLGLTQKEFAALVDKPQSVISRLENTEYGRVSVQTLLDLSRKLDIAVIIRFASFPEFLENTDDVSPRRLAVDNYHTSKSTVSLAGHFALLTAPTSTTLSQYQIATSGTAVLGYGDPQHRLTGVMQDKDVMVVTGIATVPFVGIQLSTSSAGKQHV